MSITTQNDVANALTAAMQTIAESNAQAKEATLVVEAEIVEIVDEGLGTYIVKYLGNKFNATTAHTEITYEIGDMVYVIIPNGNFDKNKVILSPVTSNTAVYASNTGENSYIIIGDNLFKSIADVSLCTYKPHDAEDVDIDTTGFAALFKSALADSRTFNFTCKIQTNIEKSRRSKGNYGLILNIPVIQTIDGVDVHKFYKLTVDINNIIGDPYNLSVPALQNFYFTLPDDMIYDSSVDPELLSFVVDFLGEDNTKPDDIFITDIQLLSTLEVTEEQMSGYYSIITATSGNSFLTSRTGDVKTLSVTAYYNGKVTKVENFDCYWFKENVMINNASDKYQRFGGLGWEVLNKVSQKNVDEDGKINYQYVTNTYTQVVKQEEIHCDTRFKCVLVKGDKVITSFVTIRNLASDALLELTSMTGTTKFATGIGNVNLQLKYYENGITNDVIPTSNVNYAWQRLDKKGNYIDNEFFVIDEFNTKIDGVYYTKIHFPVSDIDEANTILCTAYMDTPIGGNAVNRQIIGTTRIILTTGEMPSSRIVVTNGDKLYKYDADGDSPMVADYDGPLSSAIKSIDPVSVTIYKEDGTELTEDEYKVVTISWLVPINSMITLTTAQKARDTGENPGYYTISGKYPINKELSYNISSTYNKKKLDNTIIIKASAPSAILKETISNVANIRFLKDGEGGTNGSKYSAIVTYNSYGYDEKDGNGRSNKLQLIYVKDTDEWYLYNPANPKVYTLFTNVQLIANLYADGEYYGNSDPATTPIVSADWNIFDSKYNYISDGIVSPIDIDNNGIITLNGNNWTNIADNFCATIETKVEAKRATIDGSQTNSEEYIYAYYPIECTYVENMSCLAGCSPTLEGGFSRVLYASDGTNPQYDNSESFYVTDPLYENIEELYNYNWLTSSNMRLSKVENNTCKVTPASKYDNGVAKNFVRVDLEQNTTTQEKIDNRINELTNNQIDINGQKDYYQYLQDNLDIFTNFDYNSYIDNLTEIALFYSIKLELVQTVDKAFEQIGFLTSLVEQYKDSDNKVRPVYNNIVAVSANLDLLKTLSAGLGTDVNVISQINNIIGPGYLSNLLINKIVYSGTPKQNYYFSINSNIDLYNNIINSLNSIYVKLNDNVITDPGGYNDIACQIYNDLINFAYSVKLHNLTLAYGGYESEVYRYYALVETLKALVNSINNEDSNTYSYNLIIENVLKPINENISWYIYFYNNGGYSSLINELNNKYDELVIEINQLQDIKNSFGIIHVKPIIMVYNRYEMSNINGWDGNKLETGDGYLLAPQVGAGRKNTDNSFTGVVIGVKQVQEKVSTNQKIGLFGYSSGVQSIFLNAEDGSATFGVSGAGQVIIEPGTRAIIKSGNYNDSTSSYIYKREFTVTGDPSAQSLYEFDAVNNRYVLTTDTSVTSGKAYYTRTNSLGGMLIDLTTPEIKFGSGNFKVSPEGHITAKGGGSIGGWQITDTQLYSNNSLAQGRMTLDSAINSTTGTGGKIYTGNHNALNSTSKGFYLSSDGLSITGIDDDGNKSRIELSTSGDPKIYSLGHDELTKTNNGFYLGNDGMSIHNGFRVSIVEDSSSPGTYDAKLELGRIRTGNRYWTIFGSDNDNSYIGYNSDGLYYDFTNTNPIDTSAGHAKNNSVYLGTNGIRLGQKFAVNDQGQMYCGDVRITGNISASSGNIGKWNIDTSGRLYADVETKKNYLTPGYIHLLYKGSSWRQFLANPEDNYFAVKNSAFYVNNDGTHLDYNNNPERNDCSWVKIHATGINQKSNGGTLYKAAFYPDNKTGQTASLVLRDGEGKWVGDLQFTNGICTFCIAAPN